jgi:hypothetical protein
MISNKTKIYAGLPAGAPEDTAFDSQYLQLLLCVDIK